MLLQGLHLLLHDPAQFPAWMQQGGNVSLSLYLSVVLVVLLFAARS